MAKVKNIEDAENLHKKHMKWAKITLICIIVIAVLFAAAWITIYYLNEEKIRFEPINKFNAEITKLYDLDQYKINPENASPQHRIYDVMQKLSTDTQIIDNLEMIVNLKETNFNIYNVILPTYSNIKISWFTEKELLELADEYAGTRSNIIFKQNRLFEVIYAENFNNALGGYDMEEASAIFYSELLPAYTAEVRAFMNFNSKLNEIMSKGNIHLPMYLEDIIWVSNQAQNMLLNNYFLRVENTAEEELPDFIKGIEPSLSKLVSVSEITLDYTTHLKNCLNNYALFTGINEKVKNADVVTALNNITDSFATLNTEISGKDPVNDKTIIMQAYTDFYNQFEPRLNAAVLKAYFS